MNGEGDPAVRQILEAFTRADDGAAGERERAGYLKRIREHFRPAALADADPDAADLECLARASVQAQINAAAGCALVEEHFGPGAMLGELQEVEVSEPPAVIWHANDEDHFSNSCLARGEVAILAGPGGTGKSYVSLALALAAARASDAEHGEACGLRVRPGPVVLVSYEDSSGRIAARVQRMVSGPFPERLHVWREPEPLFVRAADDEDSMAEVRPGPSWDVFWTSVRSLGPSFVIVDPISAALEGISANESTPVRQFMMALGAQAQAARTSVLLIGHDTKTARAAASRGEDPEAGVVAGSATWFDAARGVLYLSRLAKDLADKAQDKEAKPDKANQRAGQRQLTCVKSNYGRTGWVVALREVKGSRGFAGFEAVPDPKSKSTPKPPAPGGPGGGRARTKRSGSAAARRSIYEGRT